MGGRKGRRGWVRRGGWAILVAGILVLGSGGDEKDSLGRKLILGFEKEELVRLPEVVRGVKPGRDSWFFLIELDDGFDFAARFEWPGATNRAWTWRCRRGKHTQGETALVANVGPANPYHAKSTYDQTPFLSYFYPDIRGKREAYLLMTTFEYTAKADRRLRNWSGYDFLRIDVLCDVPETEIRLAVEDEEIEPPVVRTYNAPAGRWVTLQLDLRKAAALRGLNLKLIANFWLLGKSARRGTVRIDNIRVVRRNVLPPLKVLTDPTPLTSHLKPVAPKGERAAPPRLPAPDRSPVRLSKPLLVTKGSVVPFGWVTTTGTFFSPTTCRVRTRKEKLASSLPTTAATHGMNFRPLRPATWTTERRAAARSILAATRSPYQAARGARASATPIRGSTSGNTRLRAARGVRKKRLFSIRTFVTADPMSRSSASPAVPTGGVSGRVGGKSTGCTG